MKIIIIIKTQIKPFETLYEKSTHWKHSIYLK